MGAVSAAIARSAVEAGATIATNAEVGKLAPEFRL
jgi:phytoene dehydrogenase-like protein